MIITDLPSFTKHMLRAMFLKHTTVYYTDRPKNSKLLSKHDTFDVIIYDKAIVEDHPDNHAEVALFSVAKELGHVWQSSAGVPICSKYAEDFASMIVYTGFICTRLLMGRSRVPSHYTSSPAYSGFFMYDDEINLDVMNQISKWDPFSSIYSKIFIED